MWVVLIYANLSVLVDKKLMGDHCKHLGSLSELESMVVASLKDILTRPPVLALSRSKGQYTFYSDASDRKTGYVIVHRHADGINHPAGY